MHDKATYKRELIELFKNNFPQVGPSLIVMLEMDIPALQKAIGKLKAQATIHPQLVIQLIDGNKVSELRTLAEHSYSYHRASNLLNQYLGNTIE